METVSARKTAIFFLNKFFYSKKCIFLATSVLLSTILLVALNNYPSRRALSLSLSLSYTYFNFLATSYHSEENNSSEVFFFSNYGDIDSSCINHFHLYNQLKIKHKALISLSK